MCVGDDMRFAVGPKTAASEKVKKNTFNSLDLLAS